MRKTFERFDRLVKFIRDCIVKRYTGQLVIDFKGGHIIDIRRKVKPEYERINLG